MRLRPPETSEGLYHPGFEHDSCGVGFVAHMGGRRSHDLVVQGIEILRKLTHRGASGSEAATGDGAGVMLQMPHRFLAEKCDRLGIALPDAGRYGVGMVFLPRDPGERARCRSLVEDAVRAAGQSVLGWRDVPVDNSVLGEIARRGEPSISQVIVGAAPELADDPPAFERRLYVARKIAENSVAAAGLTVPRSFYIATLSSRTICYKGMLTPDQVPAYYPDLVDARVETAIVLVHQRYSTNTFPTWDLAHPFRYLCHNGEINTLRGNANWMKAREKVFASGPLGAEAAHIVPIIQEGNSDSATFDNVFELLVQTGRSLPHAMMMMIPEAWEHHESMPQAKKDFYEYHLSLTEPWDGPALMAFTDGTQIGAVLDRNGLRPARFVVTDDDYVVMASEVGVLPIAPERVIRKGRLQPGRMLLVDLTKGRIVEDDELKAEIAGRSPYGAWLAANRVRLSDLPLATPREVLAGEDLQSLQRAFGYTSEDLRVVVGPMAAEGAEPIGSMGEDCPLAVLSDRPRLLYDYFKQLFAQVTNPPLDAIREELVTSLRSPAGAEQDLLDEGPLHCRQLIFDQPILTDEELARVIGLNEPGLRVKTIPMLLDSGSVTDESLRGALGRLCAEAVRSVNDGHQILILSDRGVAHDRAPIPALLAGAAVHHRLIREGTRTRCGLVIESGEPREVHHFALLIGYGAAAVNPYVALASVSDLARGGRLGGATPEQAQARYVKAAAKGVLKVMSKMGISTLQGYRGAQIFEAIGLNRAVIDDHFTWTPSRIEGIGLAGIAREIAERHARAFPTRPMQSDMPLPPGGLYQWLRDGERHLLTPDAIAKIQFAARTGDVGLYAEFAEVINNQEKRLCTLRGLLDFRWDLAGPVPLAEVEPAEEIVKRFKTGAMSFGSISQEAHETLAIAMNRIGARSNSGEGGEDPERYIPLPSGDSRSSAVKQVASARFGVTSEYLVNAKELQIKMAQGAKPGEGGQLPAHKVYEWIAKVRHSTPGVQLISPPPHHDIYSIEDLAQLIYDLKCANIHARINVKLVSEVGVGTVAAGVSKGHADVVLISGYDGGTGASPVSSIKHAGLPWELGIAEAQQTLVMNNLRGRIRVECDGQLRTGRDIAIAAMLGAEEFGFATILLVVMGCTLQRKCHLDTCSVGIATQNPELRRRFAGQPEHVVNYLFFVAEELRQWMARLGFRTIDEMVGRCDMLETRAAIDHWKAQGLDLTPLLQPIDAPEDHPRRCVEPQAHGIERMFDVVHLLEPCRPAIDRGEHVSLDLPIHNTDRTVGTVLGSAITRAHGGAGLPDDTVSLRFQGSAGQSFAAFCPKGLTFTLEGDANDYFGKGLSGAKLVIYPPPECPITAHENVVVGNVALYGATSGEAYIRGIAGERFCVRNSGATAVAESVGDHGCEYMTGGRVVVLGPTGRNFAAGMSGGIAYVYDPDGVFPSRCNREMVDLEPLDRDDEVWLRRVVQRHTELTGSDVGAAMLAAWPEAVAAFVRVFPKDYKRALAERRESLKAREVSAPVGAAYG